MDKNELVLIYNANTSSLETAVMQETFKKLALPSCRVLPEELGLPVGALAGLDALAETPFDGEAFGQSAMVFCGLPQQRLREVIAALREAGAGASSLKAVLTEANRDWRFIDLLVELAKERDTIAAMRRRARPEAGV